MFIPTLLLKKLYTLGSLTNVEQGVRFGIKNRLSSVEITAVLSVVIDGVPAARSPFFSAFAHAGFRADYKGIALDRSDARAPS